MKPVRYDEDADEELIDEIARYELGVVPIPVEIEVAVQPTPRGFSGRFTGRNRHEEDCQEDNVNGSNSSSAARHSPRARSRGSGQTAHARTQGPGAREPARVRD